MHGEERGREGQGGDYRDAMRRRRGREVRASARSMALAEMCSCWDISTLAEIYSSGYVAFIGHIDLG